MPHTPNPNHKKHSFTRQTRDLSLVLGLGMLAGVLIWAKLRLVTDIPRSAYADPREVEYQEDQQTEQNLNQDPNQDLEQIENNEIESESTDLPVPMRDNSPSP